MPETVAIIGATENHDRYAYKALLALEKQGHAVVLINPFKQQIEDRPCLNSIDDFNGTIDTVTLYVNPTQFKEHLQSVINKAPNRIIMNPGTESEEHARTLAKSGTEVEQACTLVLLSTGQF